MISRRMGLASARDFCRRMGTGLRAGVDVLRLLDSERKHGPPRQRSAADSVREATLSGRTLTDAMKDTREFFPPLLVSMTRVGEATGRMERTYLMLAEHYENQVTLRRGFMRAITWPMIQLVIGIGVISLLIYLMGILTAPTGGEMADILGLGLRGGSGVLIFWCYLAAIFGLIVAGYFAFRLNFAGVQNLIPLIYKIPGVGYALQTITLSRFAWTLSLALDAGLNPIESIRLALDATDSEYYRSSARDAESDIREGGTLASALNATSIFPEEFITSVEVAELSGTDSESIDHLAREYDQRASAAMKTLAGIATGVIWLSVAGFLITMILRIFLFISGAYSEAFEGL
ncbi:MAG: type II secretion system F family protein [Planctomycetota bacterium]